MQTSSKLPLYPILENNINGLLREEHLISEARKEQLGLLANYILQKRIARSPVRLNFICTHNSRRSHISQIWAATAAAFFGLEDIQTFSGGTEATAFNPRAVAALERAGFQVEDPGGKNPHYRVSFSSEVPPLACFSKTFDDPVNPQKGFAAVMTCSEADENCPFIPGTEFRLSLPYEDPKEADDTPEERNRYDERVRQIGRELFYAMNLMVKRP